MVVRFGSSSVDNLRMAELTKDIEKTVANLMSKRHYPRTSFEAQKKAMYEENRMYVG